MHVLYPSKLQPEFSWRTTLLVLWLLLFPKLRFFTVDPLLGRGGVPRTTEFLLLVGVPLDSARPGRTPVDVFKIGDDVRPDELLPHDSTVSRRPSV